MSTSGTYYDQVASGIPGSLAVILFGWMSGRIQPADWLDYGATGLALLAVGGLAVGLILTSVGGWLSRILWRVSGRTSNKCREANNGILPESFRKLALEDAADVLSTADPDDDDQWKAYFRYCLASTSRSNATARIDIFLAKFALARNLLILAVVLAIYSLLQSAWLWFGFAVVSGLASYSAMKSFDHRYVSEVFIAHLEGRDE